MKDGESETVCLLQQSDTVIHSAIVRVPAAGDNSDAIIYRNETSVNLI